MAKEWAKRFYSSTAWALAREYALKRDRYVCRRCKRPATMVHHRIYLTEDNVNDSKISLDPGNLESLCEDCHRLEHDEQRKKFNLSHEQQEIRRLVIPDYIFDSEGNIVPRQTPPGVGKF